MPLVRIGAGADGTAAARAWRQDHDEWLGHERLDERLARGETDAQEYRRQLKAGTTHRA